ncbi:MAG: hypothetical protein KC438_08085 [Thermomicrobiales bacterium]|nr:hypothetical protein [Thermomicrobiales bacterium]
MTDHQESRTEEVFRPLERSGLPRIEFRRSQRRDAVFYLAAFSAAILSWVVRFIPSGFVSFVARRIGDLSYLVSKQWRANVSSNISHVLDEPEDSARVQRTVRSIFQTNALNLVSLLRTPHQSLDELYEQTRLVHGDWGILDDAVAEGNGVVLLTAHLGPFDTMGITISAHGDRFVALTAKTTNRFVFEFMSFLRKAHRLELIEASSSGVREAIQVLRGGYVLCLLSDRDFFLNGRQVSFFGEETTLPIGAARLSRETGAAIVPMFTVRAGDTNLLMIEDAFHVERTSDRNADIAAGMVRVVDAIETAISIAPDQWVMFQRVWPEEAEIPTR